MAQDSKIPKFEKMCQNQNYVGFEMKRSRLKPHSKNCSLRRGLKL
jgi:hypothetical protein